MNNAHDTTTGFSAEERAAMKERAAELRAQKGGNSKAKGLQAALNAIAKMPDADRVLAERIHAIVTKTAPQLDAKTWYGFPTYARDGKNVVFFQPAAKFKSRYATLAFEDNANLDDGDMWPTSFAVTAITDEVAQRIEELVKRAVS